MYRDWSLNYPNVTWKYIHIIMTPVNLFNPCLAVSRYGDLRLMIGL